MNKYLLSFLICMGGCVPFDACADFDTRGRHKPERGLIHQEKRGSTITYCQYRQGRGNIVFRWTGFRVSTSE